MPQVPLRIAVVRPANVQPDLRPPIAISGAQRALLRNRRIEPFAACASLLQDGAAADELLMQLETVFRSATRYSITTSLSRGLLAGHEALRERNAQLLIEQRHAASAIVAAARPNGVYVAHAGATVLRLRSADDTGAGDEEPSAGELNDEMRQIGRDAVPQIGTRFFTLGPGDALLLLPGVTAFDLADRLPAWADHSPPDLEAVAELLRAAPSVTAGLVIWSPQPEAAPSSEWLLWETAKLVPVRTVTESLVTAGAASAAEPVTAVPASTVRRPFIIEPPIESVQPGTSEVVAEPPPTHSDEYAELAQPLPPPPIRRQRSPAWAMLLPLIPLGLVLLFAIVLVRGVLPSPSGPERSVADAGRIIQEAQANSDRETKARLLSDAIRILEPQAPTNASARALLDEARSARDKALNVVRELRIGRSAFQQDPSFKPTGLWKSDDGLFVLDLGGQLLYRTDTSGQQLEVALRPGEVYEGQPLGRLVTATWSPPRGANTSGQLLVIDQQRSIVSVGGRDTPVRRWTPPDSAEWLRLGPAAATFDTLFLLDTERQAVLRYAARTPGTVATIALSAEQEPSLGSAVDLAADSDLYLLFPEGRIAKFTNGGSPLAFDGTVPDRPLHQPNAIFAHPDLDRIWVLETVESRVVEFTNQGTYMRQYVLPSDMMRNAVSLHVDPGAQELRILTPEQILLVQMEE